MDTKPKLDDLRSSVWRLFIAAQVKLLDRIEAKFSQAGLLPMEWYDVLLTLKEAPEYRLRLSELAEKVLLSRSNLTRLVDRLEKADLLHREACKSDRHQILCRAIELQGKSIRCLTHFTNQFSEGAKFVLTLVKSFLTQGTGYCNLGHVTSPQLRN